MNIFSDDILHITPAQRLELLTDFLNCSETISFWIYSVDLRLVSTTSASLVRHTVFEHTGCLAYMQRHFQSEDSPLILSSQLGLMWGAAKTSALNEEDGDISYIVIGPVLGAAIPLETLQKSVRSFDADLSWRKGFITMMQNIPIVSPQTFFQYVLMLHFCATGEKCGKSGLAFQESSYAEDGKKEKGIEARIAADRNATYRIEQELLNNIRTGNLNYASSLEHAHQLSNGIRISASSPIQQAIISTTSFTSLCVRAAIDGGLSPDTAYSVGDSYIQSILACTNYTGLRNTNHAMYDDFIHRVYQHRHSTKYSGPVQSCIQYIEQHPEDELTLEFLSKRLGYTTYYLSHKFREETGITMKSYIRDIRLEKAKLLLLTTDLSIAQIAERLHFCSSSYFSAEFSSKEGILPQKYRNQEQHL